jgi:hypothetical protein
MGRLPADVRGGVRSGGQDRKKRKIMSALVVEELISRWSPAFGFPNTNL